jgi:hypothetical protein
LVDTAWSGKLLGITGQELLYYGRTAGKNDSFEQTSHLDSKSISILSIAVMQVLYRIGDPLPELNGVRIFNFWDGSHKAAQIVAVSIIAISY